VEEKIIMDNATGIIGGIWEQAPIPNIAIKSKPEKNSTSAISLWQKISTTVPTLVPWIADMWEWKQAQQVDLDTEYSPNLSLGVHWNQNLTEDELRQFMLMSSHDILKELGPISKEDYDYYESL
jgi:hypothetical protein